jgi:hypothetical protein
MTKLAMKGNLMPDKTKLETAYRWLDKAITFESEGKSQKMIDMAFAKAVALENEAFA